MRCWMVPANVQHPDSPGWIYWIPLDGGPRIRIWTLKTSWQSLQMVPKTEKDQALVWLSLEPGGSRVFGFRTVGNHEHAVSEHTASIC